MVVDKQKAALSSVYAAVFLTSLKIVVGVITGSLGILSEAIHSGLDLCAAGITLFAVNFSDKPADNKHHYGHGKIESFSALIETLLLFVTCGWIIYEAIDKLFFGKNVELIGIEFGVLTMIISIIVDVSRVKVLKKAAKEHGSQALEADALHFSSDIWSSSVVIIGLIFVGIGNYFNLPILKLADPIAALGVALIVIKVSFKLGKQTVDVLLDTAPEGLKELVEKEISEVSGVVQVADVRVRPSGAFQYIDVNVGIDPNQILSKVHKIVDEIREKILEKIPRCDIVVSTYPVEPEDGTLLRIDYVLRKIVSQVPICTNIHNIHLYEIDGKKKITAHLELNENISLKDSHELSHKISDMVMAEIKEIDKVSLYFECVGQEICAVDITEDRKEIVENISNVVGKIFDTVNCHEIKLYKNKDKISTFLHCAVSDDFTVDKLEMISARIKNELKTSVPNLENVHIHFEPNEVHETSL